MSTLNKNDKIIEVKHLSASFGSRKVLSDISFKAYKGQITVILGGSGSGKTTILKHLIGLYSIQEGSVSVMGVDLNTLDEKELNQMYLKMGVFFQNGALLDSMTVRENIGLPLEQHSNLKTDYIDQLVELKLSLVNLANTSHLFPPELSGGMLKRAALARAIIMDPPLLFCDEPGAGLDPVSLASLDSLIQNLKSQLGITVILVTHIVSSILRLADRVVFISEGKVLLEDTLKQALASEQEEIKDFFNKGRGED